MAMQDAFELAEYLTGKLPYCLFDQPRRATEPTIPYLPLGN
jgi:hypothetical protein